MKVVFRADASYEIGTGHVIRCVTLAKELLEFGVEVFFICRDLPGNLVDYIFQNHIKVYKIINEDLWNSVTDAENTTKIIFEQIGTVSWIIIDHYDIDIVWERKLRDLCYGIIVIDDLANRKHSCDILLDQNYGLNENRYNNLVPKNCTKLLGPNYLILRPEFKRIRPSMRKRKGYIQNILIFYGGSDYSNETGKTVAALDFLKLDSIKIHVVVGSQNIWKKDIE